MRNVLDKAVEKIKPHILCSITSFGKLCRLWDVENYRTAGQATDDNIIRHMRIEWRVTKATDTYSEYINTLLLFHGNNGHASEPEYYILRTLHILYGV
jgi:hypothetical protein